MAEYRHQIYFPLQNLLSFILIDLVAGSRDETASCIAELCALEG